MKLVSRVVCLVSVAAMLSVVSASAADWQPLGQLTIDYRTNPVSVQAAAGAGAVSKIRFEVKQANLEIGNVKVTFADGQTLSLDVNKYIGAGRSHVVDLPSAKEVQKIEFSYTKYSTAETEHIAIVKLSGMA